MTAVKQLERISVEEYLAGEEKATRKHEYLGGYIYAMAGGSNAHNHIATNITVGFGSQLRGKTCQPYNSDTKIRIQLPTHTRFYYPDVSVVCDSNSPSDSFQDRPVVIAEVLSRSNRRIDETEKKDAYLAIPTLLAYLLVEQESPLVTVYRRSEQGFAAEVYVGLEAVIALSKIQCDLLLAEVYAGVEFVPEPFEEE